MARSIVLRFAAQCVDCGRSLPAGTTARWFGRGRVSCCGGSAAGASPVAPRSSSTLPPLPASASPEVRKFVADASAELDRAKFGTQSIDAELARAVREGLSSVQAARLAEVCPEQRLCVRLASGARFIVAARDVQHVVACIEESLRDKVRDVMGAGS